MEFKNHELVAWSDVEGVGYEERPLLDAEGAAVPGLHVVWITLDNPEQLNSYTTPMVKDVILAFRRASNDRAAVATIFTGAGDRAFCTGGNTAEYAEYYAGRPEEYRQLIKAARPELRPPVAPFPQFFYRGGVSRASIRVNPCTQSAYRQVRGPLFQ